MYINYFLYQKGLQCPKLFYLTAQNNKPHSSDSLLHHYTHEYIKPYVKVEEENDEEAFIKTQALLRDSDASICNATFIYMNCKATICSVKQSEEGLILYIPKGNTKLKKEYKQQADFLYYVITNAGYKIKSIYILTINSSYIRYGSVDPRLLFTFHDVTMDALDNQESVQAKVQELTALLSDQMIEVELSTNCLQGNGCMFRDTCFDHLVEHNIFDVGGLSKTTALEYYKQNIISYQDMIDYHVPLNPKQINQIVSYINQEPPSINERRVNYFLDQLYYPLYFLDFETFQLSVPEYEGCHPYQSIPFQYSLDYIEEEGGEIKHKDFLGDGIHDPRYELAKHLCADIPADACIIAYNNTLEKSVIMQCAILFEEFRDHLLELYPHVYDLQIPFMNGDYYHRDMHGSYSLKSVLPALCPELSYSDLDEIHHGTEAMFGYLHLAKQTLEEQVETRKNLLNYCNLDTYAMVKVLEKLKKDLGR